MTREGKARPTKKVKAKDTLALQLIERLVSEVQYRTDDALQAKLTEALSASICYFTDDTLKVKVTDEPVKGVVIWE